ncbi:MAG: NAD(P)-binding protein, partial [Gammaproteobacteria bacterium]|nr:NAD(P)-binding protein [Gammaproteobacteria bacterium]
MTDSKTVILVGGGHNGLVCATYLAKGLGSAGYAVQILEARDQIGGAASTRCFGEEDFEGGFRVSGIAHVLHSLDPQIRSDLNLSSAGLVPGSSIETISLGREGDHLTLGATAVSGNGLSTEDIESYASFKKEFRSYAKALKPLMTNRPPRLKDMDKRDLFTLTKLGWALRFGLGANSMLEFLRVGGINIYDVLNEQFDS